MLATVDRYNNPNAKLAGAYAQVGYFLTGEHRPYDRVAGAIDRVKPITNCFCVNTDQGQCTGSGAWEIAFRWSHIDLSDQGVPGGTMTDFTSGVNWYWHPNTKLVFNYIRAINSDPAHGSNDTNIYALRAQVDF